MRIVAVDTETVDDRPWSVQYADELHTDGVFVHKDDAMGIASVRCLLSSPDVITVLHNSKFDLRILSALGIYPYRAECTMQMAYLIGEPVLSLKVLAYRISGIEMRTYADVTREATQVKARAYLERVADQEWPDPDPVMEIDRNGNPRIKFPKNIRGKVSRLLTKHTTDPSIDLYEKWYAMDKGGGRGMVEERIGILTRATLEEVPRDVAEEYAKLDAEATLAIYPYLHGRIVDLGLEDVLRRDMDVVPMIIEMEDNGVLVDPNELITLGQDLEELAEGVQNDINFIAGRYVNPRSSQQVVALLQDEGIFTEMEESTDASVLDQYREHTIVNKIQDYRAYTKLQSTYVKGLLGCIEADGRIHTHYSTTRTETGRWASSNPNLQNIPVRTELGRRIRKAFVSERST